MFYVTLALGTLFCLFWVSQLVFVKLHLDWTNRTIRSTEEDKNVGVTVIHPIKDLDFELEQNVESWFVQDYKGPVEHIFSFQEENDPAIPAVRSVIEKYPGIESHVIVNPVIPGLNGKSSNMVNAMKQARYDIVLFGDSDIRIRKDFIIKMVRPLKDEKVGITTCGQINLGGTDFWTRYFTFLQNHETDFLWAFFTKLGLDFGATGAAFAMRKKLLREVGGLEAFGSSLLEDLHLGNTLYKMGYKLVLGPFLECHVNKLGKEKSFNYAKRMGVGIKAHMAFELPALVIMLFWYWLLMIIAIATVNLDMLYLTFGFVGLRCIHGLGMRVVSKNRVMLKDLIMGPFFDLFGTFYLLYSMNNPFVTWRGIKYEVKKGGFIEDTIIEEVVLDEQHEN